MGHGGRPEADVSTYTLLRSLRADLEKHRAPPRYRQANSRDAASTWLLRESQESGCPPTGRTFQRRHERPVPLA